MQSTVALQLRGLSKRFGGVEILKDVSLDVHKGEMVTLLGPSGCGKSTTLNCVTGIVSPDAGQVLVDGADVTKVPISRRDCGLVFQSFALFPHLTAWENVAFPLRVRKVAKSAIRERVEEVLELVGLSAHGDKLPHQLSGGQQQRVGLCRALVYRPKVLLFDEPLSNLDAKLRESMRFEIREIQSRYGITSIFVTHDQQEALAISDRIAVMDGGRIVQCDTPYEVYSRPGTEFVAGFIGLANLLHGTVAHCTDAGSTVDIGGASVSVSGGTRMSPGARVICSIRPKDIIVLDEADGDVPPRNTFEGQIDRRTFLGEVVDLRIECEPLGLLRVVTEQPLKAKAGSRVRLHLPPERCWPIQEKRG